MNKITRTLVVSADGNARILTTKYPRLGLDEVGFRLNINMPVGWGHIVGNIDIDMPEPPDALITSTLERVEEEAES